MERFQIIGRQGRIGTAEIKNRLLMAPMTTLFATHGGEVTDRMIGYYAERARGGVGMIIVEATFIDPGGQRFSNNISVHDDKHVPGLSRLTEQVHSAGSSIFVQLCHAGRECASEITGLPIVAPSPVSSFYRGIAKGRETPRELTGKEIGEIVRRYCKGAERARKAGFDGVELHGAHGYLIAQFLSPYSNKRTDEYGGDIYGRLRFVEEIIDSIRQKLGDYPVIVRYNGEDAVSGGNRVEDAVIIGRRLEQAGADALHISSGFHESRPYRIVPNMSMPKMCYAPLAARVKAEVSIPVIAVGRITEPEEAETLLRNEQADFVALGRALIADPEFPNKALSGDIDDIRRCIGCNQGCIDMCHKRLPITCIHNPMVGKETERLIQKAESPRTVHVIGGGPAGMEAAYIAALRGHTVHLYERASALGGQLRAAVIPPTRGEIVGVINHLACRLKASQVRVHYNTEIGQTFFESRKSDIFVLATGSRPVSPKWRTGGPAPLFAQDVLEEAVPVPRGVTAIIGGGLVGCETADFLAERGRNVLVFEMTSDICSDAGTATRVYLTDKLASLNVEVLTDAVVTDVQEDSVYFDRNGVREARSGIDALVVAVGYAPNNELIKRAENAGVEYYAVGDCDEVANALESIHGAFRVALRL